MRFRPVTLGPEDTGARVHHFRQQSCPRNFVQFRSILFSFVQFCSGMFASCDFYQAVA